MVEFDETHKVNENKQEKISEKDQIFGFNGGAITFGVPGSFYDEKTKSVRTYDYRVKISEMGKAAVTLRSQSGITELVRILTSKKGRSFIAKLPEVLTFDETED